MRRGSEPFRPDAPIVAELASGAVVVRDGSAPPELLLLRLRAEERWCLPKGHVEPGESLRSAARREVEEETGLRAVALGEELCEVAYRFYSPSQRTNVHKTVVYFLARTDGTSVRPEPLFDRTLWAPVERALELVPFDSDRTVLRAAAPYLHGR